MRSLFLSGVNSLLFKLYPVNPSHPKPSIKCSAERKSPLQVVWDLALIYSDHQGDCTFKHAAWWEKWIETNITMQTRWGGV